MFSVFVGFTIGPNISCYIALFKSGLKWENNQEGNYSKFVITC